MLVSFLLYFRMPFSKDKKYNNKLRALFVENILRLVTWFIHVVEFHLVTYVPVVFVYQAVALFIHLGDLFNAKEELTSLKKSRVSFFSQFYNFKTQCMK